MSTPHATDVLRGWDLSIPPFHRGEIAIHERLGMAQKLEAQGRRTIRRYLTQQHREFYPRLPYLFLGSVDAAGQPWASMMTGVPGFVTAPDESTLRVAAARLEGDPLAANLREGAPVAALGIDLPTRRRNRAIGHAHHVAASGFDLRVHHTLGICPKYIQARDVESAAGANDRGIVKVHRSAALEPAARAIVARADTFFVASVNPKAEDGIVGGVDISHRGGKPGFVRIDDPGTLTTPDFVGNFKFNTLGNFLIEPRAGLLFVDFEQGDLVYVAARAEIIWEGPEVSSFAGAQRLVRFAITQVVHVAGSLPLHFSAAEFSPALARTGTWADVSPAALASIEASTPPPQS